MAVEIDIDLAKAAFLTEIVLRIILLLLISMKNPTISMAMAKDANQLMPYPTATCSCIRTRCNCHHGKTGHGMIGRSRSSIHTIGHGMIITCRNNRLGMLGRSRSSIHTIGQRMQQRCRSLLSNVSECFSFFVQVIFT